MFSLLTLSKTRYIMKDFPSIARRTSLQNQLRIFINTDPDHIFRRESTATRYESWTYFLNIVISGYPAEYYYYPTNRYRMRILDEDKNPIKEVDKLKIL